MTRPPQWRSYGGWKRVLVNIGWAVCWILQAVLLLCFAPVIFQDMLTGGWDRRGREIKRIERIRERFAFEKWQRKETASRHNRVWKNRNNFYK